jgi:hypothetical protein
MTFTSSPQSPPDQLRADFQAWRKRLARLLEVDPTEVQYAMVDTAEGHGVLHAVVAFPPGVGTWLNYKVLGEWWQEIHGARQVKFKPVVYGDGSVRRLSQYIVSQYMVTQGEVEDLLGRYSGTRFSIPLRSLRQVVQRIVTPRWRAYQHAFEFVRDFGGGVTTAERAYGAFRGLQWKEFRRCWDDLLTRGWFSVFGDKYVMESGQVVAM